MLWCGFDLFFGSELCPSPLPFVQRKTIYYIYVFKIKLLCIKKIKLLLLYFKKEEIESIISCCCSYTRGSNLFVLEPPKSSFPLSIFTQFLCSIFSSYLLPFHVKIPFSKYPHVVFLCSRVAIYYSIQKKNRKFSLRGGEFSIWVCRSLSEDKWVVVGYSSRGGGSDGGGGSGRRRWWRSWNDEEISIVLRNNAVSEAA